MGSFISERNASQFRTRFSEQLIQPVTLRLFVQDKNKPGECLYCDDTEQMVREISALSDKIRCEVHQVPTEDAVVQQYAIQRVPALILETAAGEDTGVRFYGIPSGYELGTLIDDIVDISTGKPSLAPDFVSQVVTVQEDITIKVFSTPT